MGGRVLNSRQVIFLKSQISKYKLALWIEAVAVCVALSACGGGDGDADASSSSAAAAADSSFSQCATEYQTCAFSGTRVVKYGVDLASAVEGTFTGSVDCGNASFSDPAPGATKSCWVEDASVSTQNVDAGSVTTTPVTTTTVATGAPTYASAAAPGFVAGTVKSGTAIQIDFGAADNNPAGYDIQLFRSGTAIDGTAASNVTSYSYTPTSADAGQVISATVVARNSAGASETTYIPGVVLN
jgi:hypothetical protein